MYNIRDYGAISGSADNCAQAIQGAIDDCHAEGGGTVVVPPGTYVSGTVCLKSNVGVAVERGARLMSARGKAAFPRPALFCGEDCHDIAIEGEGIIDGRGAFEWRLSDYRDHYVYDNERLMAELGLPLMRSFPRPECIGNLISLVRCTDVRIRGLSFIDSPGWTIHPYGCERLWIDGISIHTSRKEGVWADGIDPDGCKDVVISNCRIDSGDDALVFYSHDMHGPPLPCENITVTNCILSSSSSALKFCDCNSNAVRNVVVSNCVITDSNRGIAFMVFDGGVVENVVLSNITIGCRRHDWFWWGDGDPLHARVIRRSEVDPRSNDAGKPVGLIRNVKLRGIHAHGQGASLLYGHAESPLTDWSFDDVSLSLSVDTKAPYNKGSSAMEIRDAVGVRLSHVDVTLSREAEKLWQPTVTTIRTERLIVDGVCAVAAAETT